MHPVQNTSVVTKGADRSTNNVVDNEKTITRSLMVYLTALICDSRYECDRPQAQGGGRPSPEETDPGQGEDARHEIPAAA